MSAHLVDPLRPASAQARQEIRRRLVAYAADPFLTLASAGAERALVDTTTRVLGQLLAPLRAETPEDERP